MVVGSGLLAREFGVEFANRDDFIVLASGVSKSDESRIGEFRREEELIRDFTNTSKTLVYFSTCSVLDQKLPTTPYVLHKCKMESIVKQVENHVILRFPQLAGRSNNPNTLTNFLYSNIIDGTHFDIWQHATRNVIDVEDACTLSSYFLLEKRINKRTMTIACPNSISMLRLVRIFEKVLETKAHYSIIDRGDPYRIPIDFEFAQAEALGIDFDNDYVERVIRKHYG